jgi:hypothetical protein
VSLSRLQPYIDLLVASLMKCVVDTINDCFMSNLNA